MEMLEPCAVKVACTVLRGLGAGNSPRPPDGYISIMNSKNIFRIIVILDIVIVVFGIIVSDLTEGLLPETLQNYLMQAAESDFIPKDTIFLIIGAIFFIALIVSWIGLLKFKKFAPWLYLVVSTADIVLTSFMGPTVRSGLAESIAIFEGLIGGVLIALVFFSPVKEFFGTDSPNKSLEVT